MNQKRMVWLFLLVHLLGVFSALAQDTAPDQDTTSVQAPDLVFTGNVAFNTLDLNGDGIFDQLVAEVEIEVLAQGEFFVIGSLEKTGKVIATRPFLEYMLPTEVMFDAPPGLQTVSLHFSGEQIFQSGEDGPYELKLSAIYGTHFVDTTYTTPAYDHTTFGEYGGALVGASDQPVDLNGDGLYDVVEVTVEVAIRAAGTYYFYGSFMHDGEDVTGGAETFTLTPGTHRLKIHFPGQEIRQAQITAPSLWIIKTLVLSRLPLPVVLAICYKIFFVEMRGDFSLHIYDADINLRQGDSTIESLGFLSRAYDPWRFAIPSAPDGNFHDAGIDTNGNGLFDTLRISFGLGLEQVGNYEVRASLTDNTRSKSVSVSRTVILDAGTHTFTLDFPGSLIREAMIDGPYTLEVDLFDADTEESLDTLTFKRQTATYDHTAFDSEETGDHL